MRNKDSVPVRYVTEEKVKKALKIDSFRNLSKDKVMQFASMIPYMDKEVALAVIAQFPVYVDFAKTAIETYKNFCEQLLEKNSEALNAAIKGYQTILDSLSIRVASPNISEEERKSITEDMMAAAKEIAILYEKNTKFLERCNKRLIYGVLGLGALVGAAVGISSQFGGGGDSELPQLDDSNDDTDDFQD